MSGRYIQEWWKWLCGRCASSYLNCFLEAGVSRSLQGSLWGHLPLSDALSLLSQLWLVTWGAQTHMRFFRARSQLSLFTVGLFCFQCSNSVMGIPFTLWQLNKCKSLREAWMKLVFHLPQEKWEAGRDEHQTWGEEAAEQSFTQGSHHEASPGAPLHWKFQ